MVLAQATLLKPASMVTSVSNLPLQWAWSFLETETFPSLHGDVYRVIPGKINLAELPHLPVCLPESGWWPQGLLQHMATLVCPATSSFNAVAAHIFVSFSQCGQPRRAVPASPYHLVRNIAGFTLPANNSPWSLTAPGIRFRILSATTWSNRAFCKTPVNGVPWELSCRQRIFQPTSSWKRQFRAGQAY